MADETNTIEMLTGLAEVRERTKGIHERLTRVERRLDETATRDDVRELHCAIERERESVMGIRLDAAKLTACHSAAESAGSKSRWAFAAAVVGGIVSITLGVLNHCSPPPASAAPSPTVPSAVP